MTKRIAIVGAGCGGLHLGLYLRAHDVEMVTIGQYLQPTAHHHPVLRYWTPDEYKSLEDYGYGLGFSHVASGPMVRSSYHADRQAAGAGVASAG